MSSKIQSIQQFLVLSLIGSQCTLTALADGSVQAASARSANSPASQQEAMLAGARTVKMPAAAAKNRSGSSNRRKALIAEETIPAAAATTTAQQEADEQKTPFEYEYFEDMMLPVPTREEERLCGLDKVCVKKWKDGKLQIYKEGRLFEGDFNQDGIADEAIVLEKEDPSDALAKNYYIYICSKEKDGRKILLHEPIPEAHNVVDVFWDSNRKVLVIDTGGRIVKTESVTTSTGAGGSSYVYRSGQVLKVVVIITWNPKSAKFDIIVPGMNKRKHSKSD